MLKWMMSGFRIKVKSGRPLTKDELIAIGRIILYNNQWRMMLIFAGIAVRGLIEMSRN